MPPIDGNGHYRSTVFETSPVIGGVLVVGGCTKDGSGDSTEHRTSGGSGRGGAQSPEQGSGRKEGPDPWYQRESCGSEKPRSSSHGGPTSCASGSTFGADTAALVSESSTQLVTVRGRPVANSSMSDSRTICDPSTSTPADSIPPRAA